MKKNNAVINNNGSAIVFYGAPTSVEEVLGLNLLKYFDGKKCPVFQATRKRGYMQIGSAYSNFKLACADSPKHRRNTIIDTLVENRHGLEFIKIQVDIDGVTYDTYAISKDDMRILFE